MQLGLDLLNTYPFLRSSPIPIYLLMLSPPTKGDCPSLPAPSSRPLMPPHPRRLSTGEASALTITPAPFPYLSFYGEHKNQTRFHHSCHTSYLSLSLSLFFSFPPTQFYIQISSSIASFCQCFIISLIQFSAILVILILYF